MQQCRYSAAAPALHCHPGSRSEAEAIRDLFLFRESFAMGPGSRDASRRLGGMTARMPLLRRRTRTSLSSRKPERSGGYPGPISLQGKFRDGSVLARRFASLGRDDSENAAPAPPPALRCHPGSRSEAEAIRDLFLFRESFAMGPGSRDASRRLAGMTARMPLLRRHPHFAVNLDSEP
jgi:hypothetical protein